MKIQITRSTRRAQTLADAGHYSHISQCNNVEPWWWKANPKGFGSLPAPRSEYSTTIMVFAHLLILEYPDHYQNLISSSFYYPWPLHKCHPNPFITFWVMLSTDKQTNQRYQKHNLLCQGGNYGSVSLHETSVTLITVNPNAMQNIDSFNFLTS